MNATSYEIAANFIKMMGLDIEELIKFHQEKVAEAKPEVKTQVKTEAKPEAKPAVKTEVKTQVEPEVEPEVKTQVKTEAKPEPKPEVKTQVKTEAKSEAKPAVKTQVKTAAATFKALKKGKSWADTDSEEEADKPETLFKVCEDVCEDIDPSKAMEAVDKAVKEAEASWTAITKRVTRAPVSQKKTKQAEKVTKPGKKSKLVAYNVEDFVEFMHEGLALGTDFVVHEDAHCEHTFTGALCEDEYECGMVHIQRCRFGDNCTKRVCTYLHADDMEDSKAAAKFKFTMSKYNRLNAYKKK